jgi:hypothetical protein
MKQDFNTCRELYTLLSAFVVWYINYTIIFSSRISTTKAICVLEIYNYEHIQKYRK